MTASTIFGIIGKFIVILIVSLLIGIASGDVFVMQVFYVH